jgi:hypothetical protein
MDGMIALFCCAQQQDSVILARGKGPEARDEYFTSKARLFLLATSLVPLAWTVGTLSRRTGEWVIAKGIGDGGSI